MTTENNKIIAEFMNFPKVTNVRDSESGKYYDYQLPNKFDLVLEQEVQIESNNGWGLVKQDYVFAIDLIFHSEWNWLMQVVEKIENLPSRTLQGTHYSGNEVKIYKAINTNTHYCEINLVKESGYRIVSIQFNKESKIKSVYDACLEFIKWYNEQNKV